MPSTAEELYASPKYCRHEKYILNSMVMKLQEVCKKGTIMVFFRNYITLAIYKIILN